MKIAVLPGDGIGTEITAEAVKVLEALELPLELENAPVGGTAYEMHGHPLPDATLKLALQSDAILFGAVGDWKHDKLERSLRPEQAILGLRRHLGLFANFRPAICYAQLVGASSLRPELIAGLDILIVRELTGDVYFGQPRGRRNAPDGPFAGSPEAFRHDALCTPGDRTHRARGIQGRTGARQARDQRGQGKRAGNLSVLEGRGQRSRPAISRRRALDHMYVDNAAMQLVKAPKAFDVVVTGNMFGDILSDEAAMLTGSIGMLPSASLNDRNQGLYEPSHGSAPDIAGQGVANPLATILSAAMMLRFSLAQPQAADRIEAAVQAVLAQGLRTADIHSAGTQKVGTAAMGDAVVAALRRVAG